MPTVVKKKNEKECSFTLQCNLSICEIQYEWMTTDIYLLPHNSFSQISRDLVFNSCYYQHGKSSSNLFSNNPYKIILFLPSSTHLKHNQTVLLHNDDTEIFIRTRNLNFGTQGISFLIGNSTETSRTPIASSELLNGFLS